MSRVMQARRGQELSEVEAATCPLCEHPCKHGLYTVQIRDGSRRSVCAGCWVSVATDPEGEPSLALQ